MVRRDTYQGSNPGWRLEWFVKPVPSEDRPELRLWPLLSWKELSGRGEGTVQQTQQIHPFIVWCKIRIFCDWFISVYTCDFKASRVCFVRKYNICNIFCLFCVTFLPFYFIFFSRFCEFSQQQCWYQAQKSSMGLNIQYLKGAVIT